MYKTSMKRGFFGDLGLILGMTNQTDRVKSQAHCLFLLHTLGLGLCWYASSGGKQRSIALRFSFPFFSSSRGKSEKHMGLDNCHLLFSGGFLRLKRWEIRTWESSQIQSHVTISKGECLIRGDSQVP